MRRAVPYALLLLLVAGCSNSPARGPSPGRTATDWDSFYRDWVQPSVHFGTPALAVFAVLVALSRATTRMMLSKDTPGPRGTKLLDRIRMQAMYWLGVAALLWSAVEAVVVFPVARREHPAVWVSVVSIVLIAGSAAAAVVLYAIVGRPPHRQVFAPGDEALRKTQAHDHARVRLACLIDSALILAAAFLVVELYVNEPPRFSWLNGVPAPFAYAPMLAALGIVVVGRTRGTGIGLQIQGHDKTGADDAGLGALVRARLFALGSAEPSGIKVTERTDVSTLPSDALSLIPEGPLAKTVQALANLFTPATPWRVDVSEQSDGSVVVSTQRNGAVSDATVIRPSTIGLPKTRSDAAVGDATTDEAWTVELRTAAAAFILLSLARRYSHLMAGLAGATDWRSVALQVVASDPATKLGPRQKREILARAIGFDGGNAAAELALLNVMSGEEIDRTDYVARLRELLERLSNEEAMTPLRLRIRFNLLVALVNSAASVPLPDPSDPSSMKAEAQVPARACLEDATDQARHLLVFWSDPGSRKEFPALWNDMGDAIVFVADAIVAEWERRFRDKPPDDFTREKARLPNGQMTILARYERACLLATQVWSIAESDRQEKLTGALDDLDMAASVQAYREGARIDPSLNFLHDVSAVRLGPGKEREALGIVRRFKSIVGDEAPKTFLELPPLAKYKDDLDARGFHTSADIKGHSADVSTALDLKAAITDRWARLAVLHDRVRDHPPLATDAPREVREAREVLAAGLTFLFLQLNIDSEEALKAAFDRYTLAGLRRALLDTACAWDVVVPDQTQIESWRPT